MVSRGIGIGTRLHIGQLKLVRRQENCGDHVPFRPRLSLSLARPASRCRRWAYYYYYL